MQKSSSQKALRVISIIMIVFASLGLLGGFLSIVGGSFLSATGAGASSGLAFVGGGIVVVLGLLVVLSSGFSLVTAIFGLRGADDPRKIGVFFVLAIISLVLAAISALYNIVSGSENILNIFSALLGLAFPVAFVILANNIKKENHL